MPSFNFLDQTASIARVVYDDPNLVTKDGAFAGLNLVKNFADQYVEIVDDSELKGRDSIPAVTLKSLVDVVAKAGIYT